MLVFSSPFFSRNSAGVMRRHAQAERRMGRDNEHSSKKLVTGGLRAAKKSMTNTRSVVVIVIRLNVNTPCDKLKSYITSEKQRNKDVETHSRERIPDSS